MSAAETLADLAHSLGADAVGWAAAKVPVSAVEEYTSWLGAGRHAGMTYLERQLPVRADPSQRLEDVASVLVLGVSHAFLEPPKPAGGIRIGRVTRYAWTPDYHDQLQPLLHRLETGAAQLGVRARGYVDHGPIMERLYAANAFLGWRGKSGMTISTKLGAFVTLAVLLTDLPWANDDGGWGMDDGESTRSRAPRTAHHLLSTHHSPLTTYPSPSHPDRCGRCTRCISACPTDAIGDDRAIDARRCVSYLTTEHRGPVPHEWRAGVGDWLFGCDVCSEVCPWSVKAGPLAKLLQPQAELAHPDLSRFFEISERQFEREFAGTAFLRPRRKGMARNALTVLGNTRNPAGWPLLEQAVTDPAWEVREAAAWALAQWGETALLRPLLSDPQEQVRATAQTASGFGAQLTTSVPDPSIRP